MQAADMLINHVRAAAENCVDTKVPNKKDKVKLPPNGADACEVHKRGDTMLRTQYKCDTWPNRCVRTTFCW